MTPKKAVAKGSIGLRAREGDAAGKLCLATLLKALFNFASSGDQEHTVDLSRVFRVIMHVVPSRRPGWLDKLDPEESSSFCISGRVAFSNGEV